MRIPKRSALLFFAGIVFFVQASFVQAMVAPQVYFNGDPVLNKNSYNAGESIQGTVEVWNYEEASIGDMVFSYQLLAEEVNGVPTKLIDSKKSAAIFILAAGQHETKTIDYALPANLVSGNYTFRTQIVNGRGEEMAWADKVISVGGNGRFLTLDNGWILKDGKKMAAGGGVYYDTGEEVKVQFDVINESGFTMTAVPLVVTYKRNIDSDQMNSKTGDTIVLNPGERKTVDYAMSPVDAPETYLSQVKLIDPATKLPISNELLFRWILSGEGARTLYVSADKEAYTAGEEARVQVQYSGPADHDVAGGTGTVVTKLLDRQGAVVGETSQDVDLKPGAVTMKVPVQKDTNDFDVAVTIKKDTRVLDEYQVKGSTEKPKEQGVATPTIEPPAPEPKRDNYGVIAAILGILAVVLAVLLILKNKKMSGKLSCFIIFALAVSGLLSGTGAQAATQVTGGCCDTTIIFNRPQPNVSFFPGQALNFSNRFKVTSCGNGLFFNRITYYITEDKDIPITDALGRNYDACLADDGCTAGGCLSCFGAQSFTYACGTYLWGNEVKTLDMSRGYKIYKLGTVNGTDVGGINGSDWPHLVEFNKTFTIPQNLGLYGPVRLYAEYIGTHWTGHYHWNITYQKGFIRAVPTAKQLKVVQPDYCTSGPGGTFGWNFGSEDDTAAQASYRIQISEDAGFSAPVIDYEAPSASKAFATPTGKLQYNKTYHWRLKVTDSYNNESDWANGPAFTTPNQAAPRPDFSYEPKEIIVTEKADFTSAPSQCYSGQTQIACADDPSNRYSWDFGNGISSNKAADSTTFSRKGSFTVALKITSLSTNPQISCTKTKTVGITKSLPDWKEVAP